MAKSGKAGKKKIRQEIRDEPAPERPVLRDNPVHQRHKLTVMMAVTLAVTSLAWVFAIHHFIPQRSARRAEAAVEDAEREILVRFREKAVRDGIEVLGYETEVFPRITLVTYVYRVPGTEDRKAFWWSYDPATGKLDRVKSVTHFVDEFLLPTVDQLHQSVSGVPGPLARVRHQENT